MLSDGKTFRSSRQSVYGGFGWLLAKSPAPGAFISLLITGIGYPASLKTKHDPSSKATEVRGYPERTPYQYKRIQALHHFSSLACVHHKIFVGVDVWFQCLHSFTKLMTSVVNFDIDVVIYRFTCVSHFLSNQLCLCEQRRVSLLHDLTRSRQVRFSSFFMFATV